MLDPLLGRDIGESEWCANAPCLFW
jgi:hypothetical protein